MASREEALAHAVPFTRVVNYSPPTPAPRCNSHAGSDAYEAATLLDTLSCLAAAHRLFVVANVASSNCSALDLLPSASLSSCALYNTAVVFSPNASIAAT